MATFGFKPKRVDFMSVVLRTRKKIIQLGQDSSIQAGFQLFTPVFFIIASLGKFCDIRLLFICHQIPLFNMSSRYRLRYRRPSEPLKQVIYNGKG